MTIDPNGPGDPNSPEGVDTGGRTVPPYEGRETAADVGDKEKSTRDGARTAGATGPVEDEEMKAPDPASTPGGATSSPSDEQPASSMPETDLDDDRVGPAHVQGTSKAEDQP